ncbi:hypothetical protein BC628DRAFT_1410053 [Trametes gibbosa]|nr:hypothetical protein BC628DRAFT_1410053 [Trametes gibbosa]
MKANRWQQYTRCECASYGCGATKLGYATQAKQTSVLHRKADEQKARQQAQDLSARTAMVLSSGEIPQTSAEIGGYRAAGTSVLGSLRDDLAVEPRDYPLPPPANFDDSGFYSGGNDYDSSGNDNTLFSPGPGSSSGLHNLVLNIDARELVPASRELPAIRLLYMQVVLANIFGSATVDESEQRLRDGLDLLALSCPTGLPKHPKPALSLVTAKKRLGLNVDNYIEKRAICTSCFKTYSSEEIVAHPSPACFKVQGCPGIFFRIKRNAQGTERRIPAKVHGYVPLLATLQRLFLRPDFFAAFFLPSQNHDRPPLGSHELMHDFHDAAAFGAYKLGLKRVKMADGSIVDVKIQRGEARTLMSVDVGISMTINMDGFGMTEGRPHSVCGVYITFNNLHRTVRYLQHNVHLSQNIPGPKEPTTAQLVHLLEPLFVEAKLLYNGVLMAIHNRPRPREIYGAIEMRVCDLPGSRKLEAFAAHNHKKNPCYFCKISHSDINAPEGYDINNFVLRDEWEQVRHAFAYRDTSSARSQKTLFEENGQRWAKLFELPGWMPSGCAIDFMHNYYLGIGKEMYSAFLVRGHLLNKNMWRRLEITVNSITWPSGIGRLPTNLGENHSFAKADQWRRFVNIQCTVLWTVWGNDQDEIRKTPPSVPSTVKGIKSFSCDNLPYIYDIFLFASVAERILAAKSISMDEVFRGHSYLQRVCVHMLHLGLHLLPNHHLAMHYLDIFRLFGPVYAWWLYAHERFNGIQEKVRTNGKAEGEMEITMTRNWIAKQRLYELACARRLSFVMDELTTTGTLRGHMPVASASSTDSAVQIPHKVKRLTNLCSLAHPEVYELLLTFVQWVWPDLHLVNEFNIDPHATIFSSTQSARLFPVIAVDSSRYGSITDGRSSADRYACVDFGSSRFPCRILYHFELLVSDDKIPVFPWSLYANDLGVYVAYQDHFHEPEVIYLTQLVAPVAIIPIKSKILGDEVPLWAVHSFDRSGLEAEDEWFNQLSDELEAITDPIAV